jgi:hypothetical protein
MIVPGDMVVTKEHHVLFVDKERIGPQVTVHNVVRTLLVIGTKLYRTQLLVLVPGMGVMRIRMKDVERAP